MAASAESVVTALLLAGGRGVRMGGDVRKQYRLLGDAPVLVQTLRVMDAAPSVDHVVLVVPTAEVDATRAELEAYDISTLHRVVEGGSTRQASALAGLAAVPSATDIVLVHDAVRPFVELAHVEATVAAVREHGAAALAVPAVDTMRRGAQGVFGETVSREHLYHMQTPQGFRRALFEQAHAQSGATQTDDVALVQTLQPVHIVEGSPLNIKITTPADWRLARRLWPHWRHGRWSDTA